MNKTKKIWVIIASILLPVVVVVGCIIGAIVANGDKDDVENLTFDELMFTLNNQISSSSDLTNAIDDMQSVIDKSGYQISLLTYQINGQINKAEVIANGTQVTLIDCNDTEKTYFNGWQINGVGQSYNPNQVYTVQQSTNFVANMVNKAVVTFMVDGQVSNTEYCIPGNSTSLPQLNDTDTHYFNGWKIDDINVTGRNGKYYTIDQDVTVVAEFLEHPTVVYQVSGEVVKEELIKYGTRINLFDVSDTEKEYFNGWKVNGVNISSNTYTVTENVTFVADIVAKFVVTFIEEGKENIVAYYRPNTTITLPVRENTETLYYMGWKVNNIGESYKSYTINKDITFVLCMSEGNIVKVDFVLDDGSTFSPSAGNVWTDGENIYSSHYTSHYILKENNTWEAVTWNGLTNFSGSGVWTDGNNIYYSSGTSQYILKENNTWEKITWNGYSPSSGKYIWTDGVNIYYSYSLAQYILKDNNTWEPITWKGLNDDSGKLQADYIWTDGKNYYFSYVIYGFNCQYVLKENYTWEAVDWQNGSPSAGGILNVGTDVYRGGSVWFVLKDNYEWEQVTLVGPRLNVPTEGRCPWSDGVNLYIYGETPGVQDKYWYKFVV